MAPAGTSSPADPTATGVVLVGFMGSGKSHVGTLLARRLGLPFVDADALVEADAGPIATIFEERGESGFREVERRVVLGALADLADRPAVLSLGGGAVSHTDVRAALRAAPFVVWLDAPVEVLWRRVTRAARRGRRVRPLAADEATFAALYERRLPWYEEVATAVFRGAGERSPEEAAGWVADTLRGRR